MVRKGIAVAVFMLSAIGVLLYSGGNWRLLPDKYGPETELWTATRSYSFGMRDEWIHNYIPCTSNCSWETTTSNSAFLTSTLFRQPLTVDSDEQVTSIAHQLACVPHPFGYNNSQGSALFPPQNITHCKDRSQPEPRPKIWFDAEKEEFAMECPRGRMGRYVIHPKAISVTDELKLEKLQRYWRVENYPGWPVKYHYGEFVYGSCGNEFTEAILFPRFRPEVHSRAKNISSQLGNDQPVKPLIVLFLTVDSYSRRHFYRKMPKTVEYLTALHNDAIYSVFDFKVHNVLGKYSPENMVPMFTNISLHSSVRPKREEQTGPGSLWAVAKRMGFVTHLSFESCGSNFGNVIGEKLSVDHHTNTFFCAAEVYMQFKYTNKEAEHRCIGPHWAHSHLLNYTHSLSRLYSGLSQFHYLHLEAAHEGTGQLAGTLDAEMADFLARYIGDFGDNNDLAVILQGDHGMRYGNWHKDREAEQELKLPVMIMIAQTDVLQRIPGSFDSLWHNTFRLVSKRDFRATLLDLFAIPYNNPYPVHAEAYLNNAYILHKEKIPDWRTCQNAIIDPWYCSCLAVAEEIPPLTLHTNGQGFLDQLLVEIAEETVNLINQLIYTSVQLSQGLICQKLHFHYIRKAYGYRINSKTEQFQVEFAVKELDSARIDTIAMVTSDHKHGIYDSSSVHFLIKPYIYEGFPVDIQVITFSRKDAYAGPCETVSASSGLNAEFCICHDLAEINATYPKLPLSFSYFHAKSPLFPI